MSSPNPPFDMHVELYVNGAWTDVSGDAYDRNPISITHGYSGETSKSVDAARCHLTLDNRARNYSPRNPNSIYYGTLKRNTPVRVSVNTGGTQYRFWGEIAGITPSADQSGRDLTSTIEAGGLLRRLGQGAQTVRSRPRTYIPATSPTAYWPMEDGPLSSEGVAVVGAYPMRHIGSTPQTWGVDQMGVWLAPTVTGVTHIINAGDGVFVGRVAAAAGLWTVDYMFSGNAPHSMAVSGDATSLGGGGNQWTLSHNPSISTLQITGPAGGAGSQAIGLDVPTNQAHHVRFSVRESGSDALFFVYIDGVQVFAGTMTGDAPLPTPLAVVFNANSGAAANTTGVTWGHVAFYGSGTTVPALDATVLAAMGSPGESAGNRISRICVDQGITLTTIGSLAATQPCGPQDVIGIVDVLQETAEVDGGLLYETLDSIGLTYRSRAAIYNQSPSLTLTYTTPHHLAAPLAPVDDDQTLRNDVTVTRKGGSAAQVVQTAGPLSISVPPVGVGRYTDSLTINCFTQDQAIDQAGWRALNVGTWDEARFPSLKFDLSVLPLTQRAQLLTCNVGSRLTITSPPTWLPPDQIDLLIVGLKETLTRYVWNIELACVPFGPYRVAVADSTTLARPASDRSTVTTTTTATSWSVATSSGPLWTIAAADFPFDLRCEGERVTVTNITGVASPQTFTVTRSVNGIVKAHTAATIDPWFPMIAAM